jgi:hypothetical protein
MIKPIYSAPKTNTTRRVLISKENNMISTSLAFWIEKTITNTNSKATITIFVFMVFYLLSCMFEYAINITMDTYLQGVKIITVIHTVCYRRKFKLLAVNTQTWFGCSLQFLLLAQKNRRYETLHHLVALKECFVCQSQFQRGEL